MKTPTPIRLLNLPTLAVRVELLNVELTLAEWSDRATTAALLLHEADLLEALLKEHAREAKAEIRTVRDEAAKASAAVRAHAEPRPVDVRVVADLEIGEAVEIRVDTGEAIRRRALTEAEAASARQRPLDFPVG